MRDIKVFIFKLILAVAPFILYILIFVRFEPYNYWGLKPEKSGEWTKPLAKVMEFKRAPSENIILGDSRMLLFDDKRIEELTGCRYANLSTGGQGLDLSRELYDWAKTQTNIKNIIIDASFWQIRDNDHSASAQAVFAIAEQPLSYIVTRDYVIEAWKLFLERPDKTSSTIRNDIIDIDSRNKYREDLVVYATQTIYPRCQNYRIGEKQIEDIIYIVDDTRKYGGNSLIVIPPVQESIWDYVILPFDLQDELEKYKEILQKHSVVYDMEWISNFAENQDIYTDGFHFPGEGYLQFENAVFTGKADFLQVREYIPDIIK